MKKKLIPFALLFTYLLPLVGCGSKTCTITFDPNNGEEPFTMIVNKGELLTEPESPEKTAYDFKAWRYNNVKWSFKYEKVQSDMTLKAFYIPTEYSLRVLPNGGYLKEYNDSYTIESNFDAIAEIYKPGYVLDYYIDQDGNHITSLKGLYGDRVLTAHWIPDNENFIEYGMIPHTLIKDVVTISALDNLLPSSDYVGGLVYNNEAYRRYYCQYQRYIDNSIVSDKSYFYLKYEPITWVKLFDKTEYTMYMSTYVLDCFNPSLDRNLTEYSNSAIDNYVQGLVSTFFRDEEISNLYDYNVGSSTAKMFLPSMEEFNASANKLYSMPLVNNYFDMTRGIISSRAVAEEKYTYNSSYGGLYVNFYAGHYATRTFDRDGYLKIIYSKTDISNTRNSSLNIRPCIAIKK